MPASTLPTAPPRRAPRRTLRTWTSVLLATTIVVPAALPTLAQASPAAVQVLGPSGTVQGAPTISWAPLPGTAAYEVLVDDQDSFASPEVKVSTINNQFVPLEPLIPGTQHVRVRAKAGDGTYTDWSTHTFQQEHTPAPAPSGGSETVHFAQPDDPARLSWAPTAGAQSYELEISTDDSFTTVTKTLSTTATTAVIPSDAVTPGTTYHWHVRAKVADKVFSLWSAPRSFELGRLRAPVLVSPAQGDTVDDVTLRWEAVPGAARYVVQVDDNRDFSSPVESSTVETTHFAPHATFRNEQLFWRVKAVDPDNRESAWSSGTDADLVNFDRQWREVPQLLHPVTPLPPAGQPQEPAILAEDAFYQWSPAKRASRYELEVSTDPTFNDRSVVTTCWTSETTLVPRSLDTCMPASQGRLYYWRVRPWDDGPDPSKSSQTVQGLYSAVQPFRYEPAPTLGAIRFDLPDAPEPAAVDSLRWTAQRDVSNYKVEVLDSSGRTVSSVTTVLASWTPDTLIPASRGPLTAKVTATDKNGSRSSTYTSEPFTLLAPEAQNSLSPLQIDLVTPPAKVDPVTGNEQFARVPALRWGPVDGAAHYRIHAHEVNSSNWLVQNAAPLLNTKWSYPMAQINVDDIDISAIGNYEYYVTAHAADGTLIDTGAVAEFDIIPLPEVTGQRLSLSGLDLEDGLTCSKTLTATGGGTCDELPVTPVLDWDHMQGPEWATFPEVAFYQLYLARDNDFTDSLITGSPVSTPQSLWSTEHRSPFRTLPDSQASKAYHWYVRACLSDIVCGPSPISRQEPARHAFRKSSPPVQGLEVTTSSSPTSPGCLGSRLDPAEIVFSWDHHLDTHEARTTADTQANSHLSPRSYTFQASRDASFATLVDSATVDQNYFIPRKIYGEGALHWRVRTNDERGNALTWSAPQVIEVGSTCPTTIAPAAGDQTAGDSPFTWTPQSHTGEWQIQVARDGTVVPDLADNAYFTPEKLVINKSGVKRATWAAGAPEKLLTPSALPYVWRVRATATGTDGKTKVTGGWSQPVRFFVTADGAKTVSPVQNSTPGQKAVTFTWEPSTEAERYRLQYRKTGASTATSVTTYATSHAPLAALTPDTQYEWSVQHLNQDGVPVADSGWTQFRTAGLPATTTTPIIDGDPVLGAQLTVRAPSWTVENTQNTYQWLRNTKVIAGATQASYEVTVADVNQKLSVRITGDSPTHGVGQVLTDPVESRPGAAPQTAIASVITGDPVVGQELRVGTPTWDMEGVTATWQWYRGASAIRGATRDVLLLTAADAGQEISVRFVAKKTGHVDGNATAAPVLVRRGPAPNAAALGIPAGSNDVGSTLTAPTVAWDRERVTTSWQWLRNGQPINRATGTAYRTTAADVGKLVSVRLTGTLAGHETATKYSQAVRVVDPKAPVLAPTKPGTTTGAAAPKSASKATVTKPKKVKARKGKARATVTVTVKATAKGAAKPTGKVKVYVKGKVVGTGKLTTKGTVRIKLKKLKVGKHKLTAKYLGNSRTKPSTSKKQTLRIVR